MAKYFLEIYTRPTCSDCQDLKAFLNDHGISYQSHEVAKDNNKEKELISITGNRIVPALIFKRQGLFKETKLLIGFAPNRQEIKRLLGVA